MCVRSFAWSAQRQYHGHTALIGHSQWLEGMTPKAPEDKVVTAVGPHTTHILVAVVGCCFLCLWHELQAFNMIYPVDCSLSEKMKYSMGNPFPFFFFLMCGYRNIFFQNVCFFYIWMFVLLPFFFLKYHVTIFHHGRLFWFQGNQPPSRQ